MVKTPILFLIYNRPELTRRVFREIQKIKPKELFIVADGPKDSELDVKLCEETRGVTEDVQWHCSVKRLYRNSNLGLRKSVSSAVSWFFEHVESGIILEDDCIPDDSFFKFCGELLERYKNDTRVMSISGSNFLFGKKHIKYSYYFSRFNQIWGWATWRRAWKLYDGKMKDWPEVKKSGLLGRVLDNWVSGIYWTMIFNLVYMNKINSWAYRWTYSGWLHGGLSIIPARNLVVNVGFGKNATNTKYKSARVIDKLDKMGFPLKHPRFIIRDSEADKITEKSHYITPIIVLGLIYRYMKFKLNL